jgi:hypothetical protein
MCLRLNKEAVDGYKKAARLAGIFTANSEDFSYSPWLFSLIYVRIA